MLYLYPARRSDDATKALYEAVKRALHAQKRAFLVVPNQFTVEAEQSLFDALETEVLFRLQVKTFASLVRDILENGHGFTRTVLTEQGSRMLVRRILQRHDDWKVFTPGTRGEGLITLLTRSLREYRAYGIESERFETLAEAFEENDRSRLKFQELARLYAAYEGSLQGGLCDTDSRMREAFAELTDLDLFDDVTFFFDRFHSLSQIEREAVRALLQKGCDVHMAVLCDPQMARILQSAPQNASFEQLENAWFERVHDAEAFTLSIRFMRQLMSLGPYRLCPTPTSAPPAALQAASDAVFSYAPPTAPQETTDAVRYRQFRNTEQEVQALVMEVKRLVQEEGRRYQEILIFLSDAAEYGALVRRTLTAEGLPFFYDERREMTYHPLLQALRALLSIAVRGPRSASMLALAKTGLLGVDEADVEVYQKFVRRRRIEYDMFLNDRYFTPDEAALPEDEEKRRRLIDEYDAARHVNDALFAIIRPLLDALRVAKDVKAQCAALVQALRAPALLEGLVAYGDILAENEEAERVATHEQLWEAVMGVFSEAVLLFGDETLSLEEFSALIDEGLNGISPGVIPPFADRLFVGDLKRSRVRSRDVVFVLGMNDLHMPAAQKGSDLLREDEKALLSETDETLPSMHAFAVEEERLDFYAVIHLARERLYLSTAMQTSANEAMSPSDWLMRIQKALGMPLPVQADFSLSDEAYSHQLLCEDIPRLLRDEAADPSLRRTARQMLNAMQHEDAWQKEAQEISRAMQSGLRTRPLPVSLIAPLYPQETISPSEIETLARCPYRSFVQNGLRPERDHDMPVGFDETGLLMHATLDAWTAFISRRLKQAQEVDAAASQEAVDTAFQESVTQQIDAVRRERPENQFALEQMRETLEVTHERLYTQLMNSRISQVDHELAFGPHRALPGLALGGRRPITLKGRIDRVDHVKADGVDYLQVIDYKTGKRTFDINELITGQTLQLPLYLSVTQAMGEGVGSFYYPVRPPEVLEEASDAALTLKDERMQGFLLDAPIMEAFDPEIATEETKYNLAKRKDWRDNPNVLSRPLLNRLLQEATSRAKEMTDAREEGDIAVRPLYVQKRTKHGENVGCSHCPYQALCHFEKNQHFRHQRFVDHTNWKTWTAQESSKEEAS